MLEIIGLGLLLINRCIERITLHCGFFAVLDVWQAHETSRSTFQPWTTACFQSLHHHA